MSSQKCNLVDRTLPSDKTEENISDDGTVDKLNQQKNETFQRMNIKPPLPTVTIFPTCENGKVFECEEINSDKVLDESCKGILQFTNGTSSCFCQGTDDLARNSEQIVREGWSQFTRYIITYREALTLIGKVLGYDSGGFVEIFSTLRFR